MTQQPDKNFRQLSGERVAAHCEFYTPSFNKILPERANAPHPIVFNLRGGCIYIQQYIDAQHLDALFPNNRVGRVSFLALFDDEGNHFSLSDVKVQLVRLQPSRDGIGLVFRFVNLTQHQLDQLQKAHRAFPEMRCDESSIQQTADLLNWRMKPSRNQTHLKLVG